MAHLPVYQRLSFDERNEVVEPILRDLQTIIHTHAFNNSSENVKNKCPNLQNTWRAK